MTVLQCTRVGFIKSIRLVNNNGLWLDVQLSINSSGHMGIPVATFIGNVVVSDIATTATVTDDTTASSSTITFKTNYCDNNIYKLSNIINISDTTASTTTQTGALVVSGGVGIGKRLTALEINAL